MELSSSSDSRSPSSRTSTSAKRRSSVGATFGGDQFARVVDHVPQGLEAGLGVRNTGSVIRTIGVTRSGESGRQDGSAPSRFGRPRAA
jgi:hypothetical protein